MKSLLYLLLLLLVSSASAIPTGIYSGTFTGASAGWWAFFITSEGRVHSIVWDATYEEALGEVDGAATVTDDTFTYIVPDSAAGPITATLVGNTISGRDSTGFFQINGVGSSQSGPYSHVDGLYTGNFRGTSQGRLMLAISADGSVWGYMETNDYRYEVGRGAIKTSGEITIYGESGSTYRGTFEFDTLEGNVRSADEEITLSLLQLHAIGDPSTPFTALSRESGLARHMQAGWFDDRYYPWVYSYTLQDWLWTHPASDTAAITLWSQSTGWAWWNFDFGPWCYSYEQGWQQY